MRSKERGAESEKYEHTSQGGKRGRHDHTHLLMCDDTTSHIAASLSWRVCVLCVLVVQDSKVVSFLVREADVKAKEIRP